MDVLITSSPEKIPEDVRSLQDPGRPLPAGVRFFEEKLTLSSLMSSVLWGVGLIAVGLVILLIFVLMLLTPRTTVQSGTSTYEFAFGAAGAVFIFGGYLALSSVWPKSRLMRQQQQGDDTRYGIFLAGDMLVSHNWFDTTIIPRPLLKGLKGHAVAYDLKGEAKSFDLPGAFVRTERSAVEQAILDWAGMAR